MLAKKSIDIFDTAAIKEGYFITYSERICDYAVGDDGDDYLVYDQSSHRNGLITEVSEEEITLMNGDGVVKKISVQDLFPKNPGSEPLFKILGIKESVI